MRLVQYTSPDDQRHVGWVRDDGTSLQVLANTDSVRDLALQAGRQGVRLEDLVRQCAGDATADYEQIVAEKRLLPPLDHPDPAHCHVSGTGLTHLGSAKARDNMHAHTAVDAPQTDSMRLFAWGVEGGKPPAGEISVQPEWFYKGNGHWVVPPERPLPMPWFAQDGGEEAELVGLYVISVDRKVLRVGFAIGNEFSDHVMERQNYLYLAHSKLRPCSFGPELLVGELPADIRGQVKIVREGQAVWSETFLTGEDNMSYGIANLEHHHFKYDSFRRPGDVHCHFFGTATLSFSANVTAEPGDVFEISASPFGRPLRNPLQRARGKNEPVDVVPL
jgi:hypothetical protein